MPKIGINNFRVDFYYFVLIAILSIFVIRLFYIQVIQHDEYRKAALSGQLKQYEIPAERGIIEAHEGDNIVPIVLNTTVYTLFADPVYVKDAKSSALALANITGGDADTYQQMLSRKNTRYVVLAKKLDEKKKQKIEDLELKGVGLREVSIRTYPQGNLASQILGFVNDDGKGTYGVEQYLNDELNGQNGELKAITDVHGVPLVANSDNVLKDPVPGKRVRLTVDIGMQKQAEDILKGHIKEDKAKSGSVVIMDPYTGAVKAMANYPSYNPEKYSQVKNPEVFQNAAVSIPSEPGSVMKTLTIAAGLNLGVIKPNQTYFDPAHWEIDNETVTNVELVGGAQTRSIADILGWSLNTGATWVLMQMGGGKITEGARKTWNDYMTNRFHFGQKTGIEQGYESPGYVPSPTKGYGLNITYANTSFGQAVNITPLQFAAAFSSSINGGNYYRPHLVDDQKNYLETKNVISSKVSKQMRDFHIKTVNEHYRVLKKDGYMVGGKTGTSQIPDGKGGYRDDVYDGSFVGFIGGNKPKYVIFVRVVEPHNGGFAGYYAAMPLFGKIAAMLEDNFALPRGAN